MRLWRRGKDREAGELLARIISGDVHNEAAWLAYSRTLPSRAECTEALKECLHHNPGCSAAKARLAMLEKPEPPTPIKRPRPLPDAQLPDTKQCPDCAEDVKADARRCRYCGYDLVADRSAGHKRASCGGCAGAALIAVLALIAWVLIMPGGRTGRDTTVFSPTSRSQPAQQATARPLQASTLRVRTGTLSQYATTYFSYDSVSVEMLDGTVDPRANDLEELCRDYEFYHGRIIEMAARGESDKLRDAQLAFRDVNAWLNDYADADIETMFSMISKQGD